MDVIEVALQEIRNGTQKDMETLFVTAWYIWFNQNRVVHKSFSFPPGQIWDLAMGLAKDLKGALSPQSNQQGSRTSHWSLFPLGFHKVNVDGATSLYGASSCIGVIICDSSEHITTAMSKPLPAHYLPETVKVLAPRKWSYFGS